MRVASSNRAASVLVLSLVALLAMACSDEPLAPSAVAGTYVLLSIDGNPLPAPAGYQGPADGSITVIADTLRLAADGSGSLVRVEQTSPDEQSRYRTETALHYQTTEGGIAITFDCPPEALMLCIAGPHMAARLSSGGLDATRFLGTEHEELVYAPVQRLD
ncbi:MAG TPA: hypothetical protein VIR34_10630 [Gemmatimonadaceae bacterium]|jgi:hypothetical protein